MLGAVGNRWLKVLKVDRRHVVILRHALSAFNAWVVPGGCVDCKLQYEAKISL
jgi:hypothetical protein